MASSTSLREPKSNPLQRLTSRSASVCRQGKRNTVASCAAVDDVEKDLGQVWRAAAALIHEDRHGSENLIAETAPGDAQRD
jgi:hypothetical protein